MSNRRSPGWQPGFRIVKFAGGLVACLTFLVSLAHGEQIVNRTGDWTVSGHEIVRGEHIQLDGSLILPKGAKLTLTDCTLEIGGDYSRQHCVEWKGGTLVTNGSHLGGFVNDAGTVIHTVFHLYEGLWEATDTTVSNSYGISFHWERGKGILRGTRLKAGPRPDAIILSGEAEVELVDSDFPIGLGVYCNEGGKTKMDLLPGDSITATYSRENLLPAVKWRLEMTNTRVERWFLFLRRIGEWQPSAEVTLGSSRDVIIALFPHNLRGEVTLTNDLEEPLKIGNLTLRRTADSKNEPAGISMYAMYLSGDETDAIIRGRTHICEWMQSGGTVKVVGLNQRDDLTFGCTTLELSAKAKLIADNVHFGRPLRWQPEASIGEANVKDEAQLIATDISINNLRFRTEGKGEVQVRGYTQFGQVDTREQGGTIQIEASSLGKGSSPAKPKVWIYTDMSDPTLKGPNKEGTINDPDDVSAMAGYLLLANEFETLGMVVASTHRREHRHTPDQADWANRLFGEAYRHDVPSLNQQIGGYPIAITFVQSCIKESAERFSQSKNFDSLEAYPTVQILLDEVKKLRGSEQINVLCWGSLTEPAILVAHCLATNQSHLLDKLRFIAHWTDSSLHQGSREHPENVANCREDAAACRYLKSQAASKIITYHECGAIGQHGIVSGSPKGKEYFDQFRTSRLGTLFVEGKFVHNCVDHSDSATYWVLLGDYGVSLKDIAADGTNHAEIEKVNESKFAANSQKIHDELLRRVKIASAGPPSELPADKADGKGALSQCETLRTHSEPTARYGATMVEFQDNASLLGGRGGSPERKSTERLKHASMQGSVQTNTNNPLTVDGQPMYGADPSVVVADDGRLFLFPTTDNRDWEEQFGWYCYSTSDLVNWTNHGVIFSNKVSNWGTHKAWAPDIIKRDGKYYFYYYFNNGGGGKGGVGVAVADNPEGPFQEITKERLCAGHDPAVFGDEGGRYWLYLQDKVFELGDDMASFKSGPTDLKLEYRPSKFEAAYVFKRNGVYYFTIARDWNNLIYYTGPSPTGPFEFRGEFFKKYGGNNHHSIVEYKGRWILFYHEWVKNDPVHQRQLRAEYLHFNDDGTLKLVEPTDAGVRFDVPSELATKESLREAIAAHDRAIQVMDEKIRDPFVMRGPDEHYYLTGTTAGTHWGETVGVRIWRSPDLVTWQDLGFVWELNRDGKPQNSWHFERPAKVGVMNGRAIWAPEIHYLNICSRHRVDMGTNFPIRMTFTIASPSRRLDPMDRDEWRSRMQDMAICSRIRMVDGGAWLSIMNLSKANNAGRRGSFHWRSSSVMMI